ncbi:hypothetical protein AB3S75_017406 [Citrus x aurantiifolia]
MERCPDFNPLKYSRDVYSSHWDKEADCLYSILFKEENTLTYIVGVRTAALQVRDFELSRISSLFFSRLTTRDEIRSALKSRFTIRDGTEIVKSRTIAIFTKSQAAMKMCKG